MSKKFRTHYDNLGVSRNAQSEVIKAAYKALAQKYHPDRNPNNPDAERIMKIINTAYQVLIDPVRRAEHDRWIDEQEAKIYNQSTQNQNNSSENHKNQSNNQDYYDNSYTKNHQTQSTTNQRYDYTGSNNTRNNNANRQNNHAKYQNYQETYAKEKPSFWSFGRMRRTTYALLSIPTLFVWMIIRIGMEGAVSSMDDYDIATLFFMTMIELIPLYFLVFIGIKRLHDCDYKGWWILIPFVICVIWFVRPTQGTNRFGTNPRDSYADDEAETEEDYSFFGIIVVSIFINLAMISNINSQQNESNNTARDGYQKPIQNLPQTSTIQTSAPNNPQQTVDTVQLLNQTRLDYKNAVAEINRVWEQLHPSVQDYLKDEQVEFNKQREAYCKEQSLTINSDNNGREAYRYHCATQLLNERIAHLKTQINTVITPPIQPQPLPETGATNKPNLHGNSPLQIKTNTGSHYWVKIVNAYNEREEIVSYFIRGGETLDANLPMGKYIVKYAYGDTWYGRDNLFGESTRYSQADEVLEFYHNQGYTIELIQQLNGNLHTTAIDESQF